MRDLNGTFGEHLIKCILQNKLKIISFCMVFFKDHMRDLNLIRLGLLALLKILPPFGLLGLSLYLTSLLNPIVYGSYAFMFSVILFLGPLFSFGMPVLILRKTAVKSQSTNRKLAKNLFATSLVISLFSSAIACSLFYVISKNIEFQRGFDNLIYSAPLLALGLLFAARARGLGRVVLGQAIEVSFRIFLLISFIFFALLFDDLTESIGTVYIVSSALVLLFLFATGDLKWKEFRFLPDYRYIMAILRNSFPNLVIVVVQGLKNHGDIFIVAIYLGRSAVGEYSIALQLAIISSVVPMIITLLLQKSMALELKAKNYDQVRRYFLLNVWLSIGASSVYLVLLVIFLPKVIGCFVDVEFEYVYELTILLCFGRLVHSSIGPVMEVLTLSNKQKVASQVSATVALMSLVSLTICVVLFGIYGAALSTAISLIIWALLLRRAVKVDLPDLNISLWLY